MKQVTTKWPSQDSNTGRLAPELVLSLRLKGRALAPKESGRSTRKLWMRGLGGEGLLRRREEVILTFAWVRGAGLRRGVSGRFLTTVRW